MEWGTHAVSKLLILAFYALIGAFARVIIKGEFRIRSFIMAAGSVVLAVPVASLMIYFLPFFQDAPEIVIGSTYTLCGVVALSIFERIEKLHVTLKAGVIEVTSSGEDKAA